MVRAEGRESGLLGPISSLSIARQGHDNLYDDPYQPEMEPQSSSSAARRRAYCRNRDHFATIRTASLVRGGEWAERG